MRLLTFRGASGPTLGVLRGDQVVDVQALAENGSAPRTLLELIEGGDAMLELLRSLVETAAAGGALAGALHPLIGLEVLPPLHPPRGNVVCLGRNYVEHAAELARMREGEVKPPSLFTKAQTSVTGPYADIPVDPTVSAQIDWEAELGVVIGVSGKNIHPEQALEHVFGYTVVNDITARDLQYDWGGQFFKGKSLDGFCPHGPWIATRDELQNPHDLSVRLWVNGELKQEGNTRAMVHTVEEIIANLSLGMTLPSGTLIATGTPPGVGFSRTPAEFLRPGDVVETEVEQLGRLRNRIVDMR